MDKRKRGLRVTNIRLIYSRRKSQLLDDSKNRRRYLEQKEEAED